MAKDAGIERMLNSLLKASGGHGRDEGVCVTCGSDEVQPHHFRNALSRKEYQISKMCQKCQDTVFNALESQEG